MQSSIGVDMFVTLSYIIASLAHAGTYTDAPGALQGDVAIQNDFLSSSDSLYQSEILVGNRTITRNQSNLLLKFGVFDFMSIETIVPMGKDKISFTDCHEMKYDPLSEVGSYLDTPSIADKSIQGSGLEGIQLSLNFYPLHTKIYSNRGDQGNWALGLVYRTKDNSNFFSPNADGQRGSGVGAQGFGVQTSFSNKHKNVEPYLKIKAMKSGTWTGDIRNDSGTLLKSNADFTPANTVDIRGGMELYLMEDVALASYVTLDIFGQYKYASFQSIASGTYLPSVLESTTDKIIAQTELVTFQGGVGTNVQINSIYGLGLSGRVGYASPQRIEHIYEINTLGSLQWGIFGELRFRYRTTAS